MKRLWPCAPNLAKLLHSVIN